ncbi:MAG TPA: hypothetical protein VMK65_07125, partial [Longimicrobiales bacterium]|nr:hypothetical protein [Longimicrobiales bacterium]
MRMWSAKTSVGRVVVVGMLLVLGGCLPLRRGGGDALRTAFVGADSVSVRELAPGVRHAYARHQEGPWAIHVAEVGADACVALEARHAGPPLARAARVSAIAPDALVAVNADFFALPAGTPVGPQVRAGEVLAAPGRWQA